jgi:hypothetical protein
MPSLPRSCRTPPCRSFPSPGDLGDPSTALHCDRDAAARRWAGGRLGGHDGDHGACEGQVLSCNETWTCREPRTSRYRLWQLVNLTGIGEQRAERELAPCPSEYRTDGGFSLPLRFAHGNVPWSVLRPDVADRQKQQVVNFFTICLPRETRKRTSCGQPCRNAALPSGEAWCLAPRRTGHPCGFRREKDQEAQGAQRSCCVLDGRSCSPSEHSTPLLSRVRAVATRKGRSPTGDVAKETRSLFP